MTGSRNPNDQPFSAEEIDAFLSSGREADFLLELEVLNVLAEFNYNLSFCGRYEDPISQKTREFDIRARQLSRNSNKMLALAVECKNIPVKSPILALCSSRTSDEANIEFVRCKEPPLPTSSVVNRLRVERKVWDPYVESKFHCRSIVQLKGAKRNTEKPEYGVVGNQQGGLHTKWEQANASLGEILNEVAQNQHPRADEFYFFPFLVVPDGTLWTVSYNQEGQRVEEPKLAESVYQHIWLRCDFSTRPTAQCFRIAKMHITTLTGFQTFLKDGIHRFDMQSPLPRI